MLGVSMHALLQLVFHDSPSETFLLSHRDSIEFATCELPTSRHHKKAVCRSTLPVLSPVRPCRLESVTSMYDRHSHQKYIK